MKHFYNNKIFVLSVIWLVGFSQVTFTCALPPNLQDPPTGQQKVELKREISELKTVILKKIEGDFDKTAESFANSENIFRSLRVAYSFKTVLDNINNAFSLFGLPGDLKDVADAKNLTEKAVNSSLAAGSVLLVWENMNENAGRLELVFNSGRYMTNLRQMLKEAGSTQSGFGFDARRYAEGIKFQLGTKRGQEVLIVNRRAAKDSCQIIKPRGARNTKPSPLKGSIETRHYIIGVFQEIENQIDTSKISETDINALTDLVKQTKRNFLKANLGKNEFELSLPRAPGCNPQRAKIALGRIAAHQKVLSSAYSALDKNLKIEQTGALKAAGNAMLSATSYHFKDGNTINSVIETYGKVSLAVDLGNAINKKFARPEIDPAELIGNLPQEMLMSLPAELSETVLSIDTLSSFVRHFAEHSNSQTVVKTPVPALPEPTSAEIPTLFLFDVSSSMLENDKIGQARVSSLAALREIQENKRLGRADSPVSVWAFGGECSSNAARQISPFSANLAQVETILRTKIPRPDGSTPLPQAIEKSVGQMSVYLNSHSKANEGRIVLLSDGQSTCGDIRPAGVYSQARTITVKNIRFLTIGFGIEAGSAAERDLQFLATSSGGQYFPAQNQQQLSRAFEKTIRVYLPKNVSNASAEFINVVNAILKRDFAWARQFSVDYLRRNPSDPFGYYNLAVSLEGSSRYRGAAENYRKYLQFSPGAADSGEIEARIEKLEQDYRDQLFYYRSLLQSDLNYLKAYYARLFNRENEKNANEFAGFVAEKQEFYANLTDILEIRSARIERDAQDLSASLGVLNRRVGLPSFDRDAVSLLTISIGQLEDVIERMETYKP